MSATLSLSRGYGSFFWGCTKFAVSPYTNTFLAIANPKQNDDIGDVIGNVVAASVVCGILTFVVPVLPVISAFTFALASVAMLLAVASMFITYPAAVLADIVNPGTYSDDDSSDFCFN